MGNRSFASLVAGFGSGYFAGEKQKRDEARQAKIDKIAEQQAARQQEEYEYTQKERADKAAIEQKMAQNALPTNASKTNLDAAGLQQAMPQVFADADPTNPSDTMTGEEKAQHFIANSTPKQQLNNANFYAEQGLSDLGGKKLVQGDAGIATVDPKQDKQKSRWQVLQDNGHVLIGTGKTENIATGNQMIMQSALAKSEDYKQKILAARTQGLDSLLSLVNDHDNEELPITDAKVTPTADGKSQVSWKNASTGKEMSQILDPKQGAVEDQIAQYLYSLSTPEANIAYITNKVTQDRENRKESRDEKVTDVQLQKYQQDIDKGKIEIKSLPEEIQLKLQALKANINQSNASADSSRASAAKTREETKTGGKPLTLKEKTESSEIQAARTKIGKLSKDELNFLKTGDIGEAGVVTPQQKELQKTYGIALQADPKLVAEHGKDPDLDKFVHKTEPNKPEKKQSYQSLFK